MDTTIQKHIAQSKPVWYLIPEREAVYACQWTGQWVPERDVIWTGPVMPGVKFRHAAAPNYEAARKQHVAWFQEADANCNTCRHLKRIAHPKNRFGFLFAECTNADADMETHPYRESIENGVMMFHPDDWMGMPCHMQR